MTSGPADELQAVAVRLRRVEDGETIAVVYGVPYNEPVTTRFDHPYHTDLRMAIGDWLGGSGRESPN